MMDKKHQLGQFFTTNADYIIGDLLKHIPSDVEVVDPFAGNFDLLNSVKETHSYKGYDIDPKNDETIKNDSLLTPAIYTKEQWIITNPPYLARNKNKDKSVYEAYEVDDLYKASIKSIDGCGGGILIIPVNFLTSTDKKFREYFFSKYEIVSKVKVFENQVFEDTTTAVCSFAFMLKDGFTDKITAEFHPDGTMVEFDINKASGYKIGGSIEKGFKKSKYKISRLMLNGTPSTKMKLYGLDNKNNDSFDSRIRLVMEEPYFGKVSDRMFATIAIDKKISEKEQELICNEFNKRMEEYRNEYRSLFLNTYREFSRKRVGFTFAYKMIGDIIIDMGL